MAWLVTTMTGCVLASFVEPVHRFLPPGPTAEPLVAPLIMPFVLAVAMYLILTKRKRRLARLREWRRAR